MANPQQKSNREHSFDSELASLVGIEKAILLKNISYWVDENERKKLESSFAYGKWWTFESLTSLAKKYPYMKRGNLSRWFKELKQDKWILMFSTTDGANMYTNGPVFNSWNLGQDWRGVFQNETGRVWGELFQNETKAVFQNETKGAAHFETHNNIEKDIEKNVELERERESKKNAPAAPKTYEEMMERVESEALAIKAEKEKAPLIPAAPPAPTSAPSPSQYGRFNETEEYERIEVDTRYRELFTFVRKIPQARFDAYFAEFQKEQIATSSVHNNARDLRQHFLSWAEKRHKREIAGGAIASHTGAPNQGSAYEPPKNTLSQYGEGYDPANPPAFIPPPQRRKN